MLRAHKFPRGSLWSRACRGRRCASCPYTPIRLNFSHGHPGRLLRESFADSSGCCWALATDRWRPDPPSPALRMFTGFDRACFDMLVVRRVSPFHQRSAFRIERKSNCFFTVLVPGQLTVVLATPPRKQSTTTRRITTTTTAAATATSELVSL